MDQQRLDRARAEFRELVRQERQAGPGPPTTHVHPESVQELYYTLDKEELIARHDVLAEEGRQLFYANREEMMLYLRLAQMYLDELRRRETVDQGERMEALNRSLNRLTWVITVATILGVGLTAWAVLSGA